MRKLSRVGIVLCSLYAVICVGCIAFALMGTSDYTGRFIFLQLPIAAQGALLQSLGLAPWLAQLSWVGAYLIIGLPTFALLYFAGWLIDGRRSGNASGRTTPPS